MKPTHDDFIQALFEGLQVSYLGPLNYEKWKFFFRLGIVDAFVSHL